MIDNSTHTWRPVAAWSGGTVSGIAVSPHLADDGVSLTATAAGLYRSADGGRSWALSMQGIEDPAVQVVRFAPADKAAFAATEQGRLYRSQDEGRTWHEIDGWAGLGTATDLACSPAYADDRTLFVATADGIYRTLDDGRSWESCTFGLLDPDVLCIACAPDFGASEVIWAGTALGGFFRSRNAGRAWRDSGAGLPDVAIQCLGISPTFAEDATLYVGTEGAGLYRSTDGGVSWSRHGAALSERSVNCLAVLPAAGEPVLLAGTDAGIFRSDDGGVSWSAVEGGEGPALALAANGSTVVAATYRDGVLLSPNGGGKFAPANHGLCAHIPPLAVSLEAGGLALLDVEGQLAVWDGESAAVMWSRGRPETIRALAACRSGSGGAVFLIVEDELLAGSTSSFERDDWTVLALPVTEAESVAGLRALDRAGSDPYLLLGDVSGGLHLSADGGASWRELSVPWQSQTLLQAELWNADGPACHIVAASAAPTISGNYAVNLWESRDSGEHWTVLASLETEVPAVLMSPAPTDGEQALFVATRHRVIKLYQEPGSKELAFSQHFFADATRITGLGVSPSYGQDRTVYAAGNHGIYRSQDGGRSWHAYGVWPHQELVIGIQTGLSGEQEGGLQLVSLGGRVWRLD